MSFGGRPRDGRAPADLPLGRCDLLGCQRIEDARKSSMRAVVFSKQHIGRADHTPGIAIRIRHVRELSLPRPGAADDGAVGMGNVNGCILEGPGGVKGCGKVEVVFGRRRRGIGVPPGEDGIEVLTGRDLDRPQTPEAPDKPVPVEVGG